MMFYFWTQNIRYLENIKYKTNVILDCQNKTQDYKNKNLNII